MRDDYKDILFEIKDYVCTITINRPKSLNAFTGDTIAELEDDMAHAQDDQDVDRHRRARLQRRQRRRLARRRCGAGRLRHS